MQDAEFERELERRGVDVEAVAEDCLVGSPIDELSDSYFGGLPRVDPGFLWPLKNGHPLQFVGQLKCAAPDLVAVDVGYLLFFYDNRHWGHSPKDLGHAIVLHQQGERQLEEADLPECQVTSLFGLLKRTFRPTTSARVDVSFQRGVSYPSSERMEPFDDEELAEC